MNELRDVNGDLTSAGVDQIRNAIANQSSPILNAGTNAVSALSNLLPEKYHLTDGWFSAASTGTSNPGTNNAPTSGSGAVRRSSGSSVAKKIEEWYNAPLATRYGMNATTAYQEALANTAHQREIEDLKAAGLNPILSTRYGGSAGVSGAELMTLSSGSGGYSGGSGSGTEKKDNSGIKALINAAGTVAGIVAAIATKKPSAITIATNSAKAIGNLLG